MYVNDKVKLYLLVKKKTDEEIKLINEICKSQYAEENNIQQTQDKKSYLDCNEAWLHKETFDLLINNNILPYTEPDTTDEKSNIHVLCTNKTIDEIAKYYGLGEIKLFEKSNEQYIELNDEDDNNEKYILTECHFKWDNDDDDDNDTLESRKIYDNHMKSYDINSTSIQKLEFQYKGDELFAKYLYNLENNKRFLIKHGPLDLDIKK